MRIAYFSAVNDEAYERFVKIRDKLNNSNLDVTYFLCVYDQSDKYDAFVKEKLMKWEYVRRYLTPEVVKDFDYIMFWDDDLVIADDFDFDEYFKIIEENNIDISQPALDHRSHASHYVTYKQNNEKGFRFTNFVEVMCPVYKIHAYLTYLFPFLVEYNDYGWGYDCIEIGIKAIVDKFTVWHIRPVSSRLTDAKAKMERFFKQFGLKQYKNENI